MSYGPARVNYIRARGRRKLSAAEVCVRSVRTNGTFANARNYGLE